MKVYLLTEKDGYNLVVLGIFSTYNQCDRVREATIYDETIRYKSNRYYDKNSEKDYIRNIQNIYKIKEIELDKLYVDGVYCE